MTSSNNSALLAFAAGAATAWVAKTLLDRRKETQTRTNGTTIRWCGWTEFAMTCYIRQCIQKISSPDGSVVVSFLFNHSSNICFVSSAGATIEGNDLSLFYSDPAELTTITKDRRFLPKDVYATIVQDSVVCCVDILAVRTTTSSTGRNKKKECLLVERGSEPVKGVWWLPGGRLLKGETFFAAATRKAREETGLTDVQPVQVLGVWNTFFPTSNWDTEEKKGTQTVNPIVLVELQEAGADVQLDETSENYRWIGLDPATAEANGEDRYVVQALLRLQAWNPGYNKS